MRIYSCTYFCSGVSVKTKATAADERTNSALRIIASNIPFLCSVRFVEFSKTNIAQFIRRIFAAAPNVKCEVGESLVLKIIEFISSYFSICDCSHNVFLSDLLGLKKFFVCFFLFPFCLPCKLFCFFFFS